MPTSPPLEALLGAEASRQLDGLSTLEQVVRWGLSLDPPRLVAQVITQDEYTLDVCLPVADDVVLVFDST